MKCVRTKSITYQRCQILRTGEGVKSRPKNKRQIRATTDGKPEAALGESEIMSQTK